MPRRVFKKFAFKRHHMANQWFMTPFRHMLQDHRLWGIRRRWVVPTLRYSVHSAWDRCDRVVYCIYAIPGTHANGGTTGTRDAR